MINYTLVAGLPSGTKPDLPANFGQGGVVFRPSEPEDKNQATAKLGGC
jgi:hypothetical protein